jgi:hypothetical protein
MNRKFENTLSYAAVIASTAAIISVWVNKSSPSMEQRNDSQLADLASRIERIEKRLGGISNSPSLPENQKFSAAGGEKTTGSDLSDLEARQSRLEQQLKKYGIFERFEEHEKFIEESYQLALDARRPAKERFEALKVLNQEGKIDEAVVASMMDLWDESLTDEKIGPYHRWALMENLRGSNDPRFRDNVLSMLQEEPGSKMTGQAIATLEPMLPDPAVQEWLSHLSANGQDPKIRDHATNVLQNAEAGNE